MWQVTSCDSPHAVLTVVGPQPSHTAACGFQARFMEATAQVPSIGTTAGGEQQQNQTSLATRHTHPVPLRDRSSMAQWNSVRVPFCKGLMHFETQLLLMS